MVGNYCFHAFGATIADFDAVSVQDLVEAVVLKNACKVGLKNICQFLWLHFY